MSDTLYEGMFLYDPAKLESSSAKAIEETERILNHAGASIECISKYDDRKLAYEIGPAKRGLYILTYFRVDGAKIATIERDVSLSEIVVRCLIIKADHFGDIELEEAKKAALESKDAVALEGSDDDADDSSDESGDDAKAETADSASE